jgi:DNA processing protein
MRRAPRPEPSAAAVDLPMPSETLADRVVRAFGPEPLAVDELIRECDAASPDVQAALLELELAGRIDRQPGNRVCLRAG